MNRSVRLGTAALAITAFALAGCGRSNTPAGGAATASAVASGAATGTVEVWAMGTEGQALQEFSADFVKANPGVTIKVTAIPWDAAHDKIATAIAGQQTPDVSMIGTTWMGEFAKTGALDPTPDVVDKSTFFKGAWDTTDVGGTNYGVPWYVETRVLYYRSDLAGAAGAPKDWAGLKEFGAAMKAAGAKWGMSFPAGQTGAWQTFMPFAWQAGATILDDKKAFSFDTPEFVSALTYYKSLFTDGLSPTDLATGALEPGFIDGSIGAFISGPWHVGILKDQGGADFMSKVGLSVLPKGDKASASFVGGANLAVFKDSKSRDAAWKFVQWLSQPDVQAKWFQKVTDLPSVTSAWDDPSISGDKNLAVFGEQMKTAVAPPSIPTWEQVAGVIDTELEKLTKTNATPQEIATSIQEQATAIGTGL